jgi:putative Mg2+ transporter-C (MgtC) family protein
MLIKGEESAKRENHMISFPTILLRLGVALVLGAVVGFERELRYPAAGIRTLALVSLGSALFTLVSAYGFLSLLSIPHLTLDPTRIASYIVAGIGFLGGGTIFLTRDKERVKGLTTAATIWVVAALGMTCGAGLILEAIATTALVLIVLVLLRFVEQALLPRQLSSNLHHLQIEVPSVTGQFIANIYETCSRNNVSIERLNLHPAREGEAIDLLCRASSSGNLAKAVGELRSLPEVNAIQSNIYSDNT